ncbi:MAG: toll/interleukin-1 receptor domain-containing protein [Cyanobacteria bacterium J06621_8]
MTVSVFLSHNAKDKPFVKRLARDLDNHGIRYWLDEAELKVGDSLIEKIRAGIDDVDFVAVILSSNSISSPWVQREIDVAMNQEISGKKVKVLPIMYEKCDLPGFLLGKLYVDFTDETNYETALRQLVNGVGVVFNKRALEDGITASSLHDALNKAININLPLFGKPFHRPFQYMGMKIADAAKEVNGNPNKVGNIIVDTDDCRMYLEAEGNYIQYVQVNIKKTAPQYLNREFDSEPVLAALSINPAELDFVRKQTHFHTYYDHRKKLKIIVSCPDDDNFLIVGFSAKYYGD